MVRAASPPRNRAERKWKEHTTMRDQPRDCVVFGIDIGEPAFPVIGLDQAGAPFQKVKFRRETTLIRTMRS
jgi:hypothetical protein